MADQYFRYVDGVLKRYTAAEYSSSFGSAPTQPRSGERLFGTRYENGTFYTGSVDANNGLPMMKLKKIIENVFEENELNEEEFLSDVANYNQFGKSIYRNDSIYEVAKTLSEIARQANIHAVKETEDSFDKITVSRNMKELKSYSDQFNKVAKEAHGLQQRMESLYEDMGRVLNRYYDINELEEGGPGSGRPTKAGSKRDVEKRMDKAVDDANAKLDAAEKAMKKKKNEGKLSEAVSFDVKKMLSLVKKDKFLKYVAKKDFKGKVDPRTLEQIYFMYVKGDRGYEKLYKKIK